MDILAKETVLMSPDKLEVFLLLFFFFLFIFEHMVTVVFYCIFTGWSSPSVKLQNTHVD